MKREDIVVGQTYRIRQWEDMLSEFGLEAEGIPVNSDTYFSFSMKNLCGVEHTVTGFDYNSDNDCLPDRFDNNGFRSGISAEMLEPLTAPIGMYGESPRVRCGKFSICRQDDNSVWIQIEGEEGMQVQDDVFEAELDRIFKERF